MINLSTLLESPNSQLEEERALLIMRRNRGNGLFNFLVVFAAATSTVSALRFLPPTFSLLKSSTAEVIGGRTFNSMLRMSSPFETDDEGVDDAIGAPVGPLPSVSRYRRRTHCNDQLSLHHDLLSLTSLL